MAEQYIYRVWCVTEAAYVETDWSTSAPTECPNDPGHTIDTDSITIIKTSEAHLRLDGTNSPDADIDFNAKKITNLADPTAAQEGVTKSYTDDRAYLTYVIREDRNPYMPISSATWETVCAFIYDGSDAYPISEFKVLVSRYAESGLAEMRLYDVTNNNEIGYVSWTTMTRQILTDSSLTNIPTGQAVFELQGREAGSSIYFWSFQVR
jgi:hypothetical protein